MDSQELYRELHKNSRLTEQSPIVLRERQLKFIGQCIWIGKEELSNIYGLY